MNLSGTQWGVMNETGSYPGQPWPWLYTLWYQIPSFGNSVNADLIAIYLTGLATLLLLFIPFIPGLRDIPRWIPVHRLIWRNWNPPADGPVSQPDPGPSPNQPSRNDLADLSGERPMPGPQHPRRLAGLAAHPGPWSLPQRRQTT
jgi:hypothetical protein